MKVRSQLLVVIQVVIIVFILIGVAWILQQKNPQSSTVPNQSGQASESQNSPQTVPVAPQSEIDTPFQKEYFFRGTEAILARAQVTSVITPGELFEVKADNRSEMYRVAVGPETIVEEADYVLKESGAVDYFSVRELPSSVLMDARAGEWLKITVPKSADFTKPVPLLSILLLNR